MTAREPLLALARYMSDLLRCLQTANRSCQQVQAEAADIDPSLISSESKGSAHSLAASLTRTQGSHSWRQIATRAASQIEHPNPAPITIALMTDHYFGAEYARKLPDCNLQGVQLDCTYFDATDETQTRETEASTATWWHAPSLCDKQVSLSILLNINQHESQIAC